MTTFDRSQGDEFIRGGALQTPLVGATIVRASWSSQRAVQVLMAGFFDQAPVMSGRNLTGYALRSDLETRQRGKVRGAMKGLNQKVVLSEETPLGLLMQALDEQRFVFIVGSEGISGFVTPSDLNKHAARLHLFERTEQGIALRSGPRS